MPAPRFRSRTFRRVFVKLPGGTTKIQYRKRKPAKAHCAGCGALLPGVPRERPYKMQRMPKTQKRPERKFGGLFCTRCSRLRLKQAARHL
ncbi:MAG TPA: 50S ribosomal protein L34e [Nanoarchaeota archaeon]|nr:50S ribosomal protein L34e [Nanoarchaeota archaeon]